MVHQLDPEGHLFVGNRFPSFKLSDYKRTTLRQDDVSYEPDTFLSRSRSTPWEMNVTRLCQRVRDVQVLLQEDLQEIEEPMNTLGNIASTLSDEYAMKWDAAKTAYAQALLECRLVLDRILSPFTETQKPHEQIVDLADNVPEPVEVVSR